MIGVLLLTLAGAPALTVLASPQGSLQSFGGSEVLRALGAAIEDASALEAMTVERAGIDPEPFVACTGHEDSACWVRAANSVKHGLRFRFLFVASTVRSGENKDRVTVLLVDTENSRAIRAGPEEASPEDPGALDALLARYMRGPFRELLATVEEPEPPVAIVSAATATVSEDSWLGPLTIAGVSAAAVGTALVAVAVVAANNAPGTVCLARDPAAAANCEALGNAAFAYATDNLPARDLDVERGVLHPGPLGAGLVAAGAGLAVSAQFFDESEWWWPVLIGLAAGTATYSAMEIIY